MDLLIEGIKESTPKIDLNYTDIEDANGELFEYTYSVSPEQVIDALVYLDKLPEDLSDEEVLKNIDSYVDENYDDLLDYFKEDAEEEILYNNIVSEPDWDSMPGGYDDLVDRKMLGDD